jgi:hypothetical protein
MNRDGVPLTALDLPLQELYNRGEFEAAMARATDRIAYEDLLQQAYMQADHWYLPAFCQACGNAVGLLADKQYGWNGRVNFRERLSCPVCQLNTRQRFMAHLVRKALDGLERSPRVYLYEQITPFFQWARASLAGEVLGSEYLGHEVAGGAVIDGVSHEDALAMSFEDARLDLIISRTSSSTSRTSTLRSPRPRASSGSAVGSCSRCRSIRKPT